MEEKSSQEEDRQQLLSDYRDKPSMLARQFEKLLSPCTDPSQTVLQCEVIDLITELCGVKVPVKDEMGDEVMSEHRVLLCKGKIAKELADTVLSFARAE